MNNKIDLKISEYIADYTSGDEVHFVEIWQEIKEFLHELIRFRWHASKEEFSDVLHFIQMYLYWKFGLDRKVWKSTEFSLRKFMGRLENWRKLYAEAGLDPMISNFCGNCSKEEKVVKQLSKFGVDELTAKKAFQKIIKNVSS